MSNEVSLPLFKYVTKTFVSGLICRSFENHSLILILHVLNQVDVSERSTCEDSGT